MASIVVTIDLDFISNFTDPQDYRVCWRIQGSGDPYDCTYVVTCPGGGIACPGVSFTTSVNDTSCDGTVTFEGYMQPTCENEASVANRLPWTVDFIPVPVCERYEITINDASVSDVTIKDPGIRFEPGNPALFTRDPGDLYPEIPANIAAGDVSGGYGVDLGDGIMLAPLPTLISGGTGYLVGDIVNVIQTPLTTGITAQLRVITAVGGGGEILPGNYVWQTAGSEYYDESTFTFTTSGLGIGADFDIVSIEAGGNNFNRFGAILNVNVTAAGKYSINPTTTLTTGTGSGADLSAVAYGVTNPWATGVNDCTGAAITVTDLTLADEPYAICSENPPVSPADIDVVKIGCCIAADSASTVCTTHTVENPTGAPIDCEVTECGGETTVETIAASTTEAFCVIEDGINARGTELIVIDLGLSCS